MGEQLVALALTKDELEKSLGVFFIGYVFSSIIYGFNFFQTWRYSSLYSSDPVPLKTFVAIVCLLDLGTVALVSHALYIYLIEMFPRTIGLVSILTTLRAEILLAAISVFLVQSYYAYRLWLVHRRASTAMALELIALCALALSISRAANVATNREFEALGRLSARVQISVRQGLVLLAGLLLAIVQWYLPLQKSTSGEETPDWFDKLVLYVIRLFSVANIVQLGYFIAFAALPNSAYWLPFHLCAEKLYVNAFLNEMNSRPVARRRRHGGISDSFRQRSFVNPGACNDNSHLPDSQDDNKATTIQLQDVTEESSGQQSSHLDSSKHDPHLNGEEISPSSWDPPQKQPDQC